MAFELFCMLNIGTGVVFERNIINQKKESYLSKYKNIEKSDSSSQDISVMGG